MCHPKSESGSGDAVATRRLTVLALAIDTCTAGPCAAQARRKCLTVETGLAAVGFGVSRGCL